ncbi:MAG TPA: molybdopterin molybdotransferase MoeA [Nitrososphaeraceae archaeon]|nr:molybdopterin molybdotransferase MoeA [Nitrososphaeraceae archaeon]
MHKESNSYLSIRTAFNKLRKNIVVHPVSEEVNTRESLGRVLYNDIISSIDIPIHDSSHMDGFAVLYDDIIGAARLSPVTLKVINDIKLGNTKIESLHSRQASRIPTGGYLPRNSDTVIPIEYVKYNENDKSVKIFSEFAKGSFVSPAGKDISKNKLLFKKGHLIRTQDISLLNLVGIKKVNIFKKPKVAIIATGNELTNNIEEVTQGKVLNTNGPIICTLVEASGGISVDLGITTDNIKDIQNKIKLALTENDIILTIGGSSVGHKDLLAESINSMGHPGILAEGIKLDRGRVTKIAVLKHKPIIILPGPIQGAVNAFIVLAMPLIRSFLGLSHINEAKINAHITDNWNARKQFQNFVKIIYVHLSASNTNNRIRAKPITGETSNMTIMTRANGYVIVHEKIKSIEKENEVQVNLLSGFSFPCGNPIDLV